MKKNPGTFNEQNPIKTPKDLGQCVRARRKARDITLERLAGLSNVSTKFLSEFERGKETAEIGKILKVLNVLGLETVIQPRTIHAGGRTPTAAEANAKLIKTGKNDG